MNISCSDKGSIVEVLSIVNYSVGAACLKPGMININEFSVNYIATIFCL